MKEENDLICIYDDTKESFEKVILKVYETFVESELNHEKILLDSRHT